MEHIVVVMSGGFCPAAHGARNVQDHMVKNHSVVTLHSPVSFSLLLTHSHTHTAHKTNLAHKQMDAHKDTLQTHTQITHTRSHARTINADINQLPNFFLERRTIFSKIPQNDLQ